MRREIHMTTVAEQMADLDRRIPYLEKAAEDLRQQMTQLDKTTHQYVRLSVLLRMGGPQSLNCAHSAKHWRGTVARARRRTGFHVGNSLGIHQ